MLTISILKLPTFNKLRKQWYNNNDINKAGVSIFKIILYVLFILSLCKKNFLYFFNSLQLFLYSMICFVEIS